MTDLDDTSNCPQADRCSACDSTDDLAVHTATTRVGVICLTLCVDCSDAGRVAPRLGLAGAVRMSLDHCAHLDITADAMHAAMDATDHTVTHYGPNYPT